MSAHTKGPFCAFTKRVVEKVSGFEVCTVAKTDKQQHPLFVAIAARRADALLFAAAPDLLAACEDAEQLAADLDQADPGAQPAYTRVLTSLRAAIAKAGGK